MNKSLWTILLVLLLTFSQSIFAENVELISKDTAKTAEIPKAEQSVTHHSITINGKTINYTATAGTLLLRDGEDKPEALMGYVAYTLDGVKDNGERPVTFSYNGGPGSSSIWLHMGVMGPKRIVTTDAAPTPPPPYKIVDNEFSLLDKTDIVMIDPVGTGYSKAVGKKKDKDFWGVDQDIHSVGQFIKQYVSDNNRWNSPKYLLGESYGTTRSAGLVNYLQSSDGMAFNGVVLVSSAMDIGAIFDDITGNERPFALFLPTYAAVSWYHHALPDRPEKLLPFLNEVRKFALGKYTSVLMMGNNVPEGEFDSTAEQLHIFTGLSVDYIKKANLRVKESQYTAELLRERRETVGRLDARFLGTSIDPLSEGARYDPQSAAITPAFTAAFLNYMHNDLKFGSDKTYNVSGKGTYSHWDWKHKAPGGGEGQWLVNTDVDLAHAMTMNPHLKVLVLQGYYDLATPTLATEYMVSHLNLTKELQKNIKIDYFEAGHMMYLHLPSLEKMKKDVGSFIDNTK